MPKLKEKAVKRTCSDHERDELTAQIESEKAFQAGLGRDLPDNGSLGSLREADGLGVDAGKVAKRIGALTKALKEGEAPVLRGAQRNAAVARHRFLAENLPERLLTVREQDLFPKDGHDYQAAVRKAVRHEIGNIQTQKDIEEYRTLGRSLHPEDPEMSSVERLRKKH
jgi:hypothetical protein